MLDVDAFFPTMKLYTKTGDDGTTGLFGGQRVRKDCLRVEAYGTVDELNAALGLAAAACRHAEISAILARLRSELFDLGAVLCSPPGPLPKHIRPVTADHIDRAERDIDALCQRLPQLKNFILPGGGELAARLHLARCIARRAERTIITLADEEPVDRSVLIYTNRLSDLLFAMARRANQLDAIDDVIWSADT
jgi:cob(I)alamin adenosyltransferase